MLPKNTTILPNIDSFSDYACKKISNTAQSAIKERQQFRIVLAGGSTPAKVYQLLAKTEQDWVHWEIFWGDERCLPVDHPERNSTMACKDWLDHVNIPQNQIYPIPAELGADKAAELYSNTIAKKMPFDLVLLGMGEDGHTASLFPDNPACNSSNAVVAVYNAPKVPTERVSLNFSALQNTREQIILVSGEGKAGIMSQWSKGIVYPVVSACISQTTLFMDEAAASQFAASD